MCTGVDDYQYGFSLINTQGQADINLVVPNAYEYALWTRGFELIVRHFQDADAGAAALAAAVKEQEGQQDGQGHAHTHTPPPVYDRGDYLAFDVASLGLDQEENGVTGEGERASADVNGRGGGGGGWVGVPSRGSGVWKVESSNYNSHYIKPLGSSFAPASPVKEPKESSPPQPTQPQPHAQPQRHRQAQTREEENGMSLQTNGTGVSISTEVESPSLEPHSVDSSERSAMTAPPPPPPLLAATTSSCASGRALPHSNTTTGTNPSALPRVIHPTPQLLAGNGGEGEGEVDLAFKPNDAYADVSSFLQFLHEEEGKK